MSKKTMVTILTGVMLAAVLTMSVVSAKDTNCKSMCEKMKKCPEAQAQGTIAECIKGCKAMKVNLRKELADAFLACADINMCGKSEASEECMKKAMALGMAKEVKPTPGADKLMSAYCDKMIECLSKSGAVPPAQLTAMKGQCMQNMAMSGMERMLSKKGVANLTACMKKSTCENLDSCMAEVFGGSK